MASLKVAAYCADTAAIVRGHHRETDLFRMNATKTERLTISQSAYLIVLYIVVW